MKKLLIAVASVVLALLPGERASAMTCTQQVCPTGGLFGPCQCIAADPDPPPGFATCTVGQPAVGECKFYTRTGGEGYCFKRSFPSGQNTNVTDFGDLENGWSIQSYWCNLARESTTFSANDLSCTVPNVCRTVPVGLNGLHNGPILPHIKTFTARN